MIEINKRFAARKTVLDQTPLVQEQNEQVVTTSLIVAEEFEKRHDNVMRDVERLCASGYFTKSKYTHKQNGQEYPMYYMTKEGFLLLTASYRGEDVLEKKLEILKGTNMIPPTLPERREVEFFEELKEALQPIGIHVDEQYPVLDYKIDGYIESLNLAIEYDEVHHDYKRREDEIRQKEIVRELGCKFIRLPEGNSNSKNIGIVFREIMKARGVK